MCRCRHFVWPGEQKTGSENWQTELNNTHAIKYLNTKLQPQQCGMSHYMNTSIPMSTAESTAALDYVIQSSHTRRSSHHKFPDTFKIGRGRALRSPVGTSLTRLATSRRTYIKVVHGRKQMWQVAAIIHSGCFHRRKSTATESRYPTLIKP